MREKVRNRRSLAVCSISPQRVTPNKNRRNREVWFGSRKRLERNHLSGD